MSEIDHMIRARQVQDAALAEISGKITSCKASLNNFKHLSDRIETLPNKLSYDIMVPFGKFAFMPGKLVHTNELMVHLGDSYFASMTCKQALKVIELRQKNLGSTLTDLEKIAKNIGKKSEYMGEIRQAADENDFEIREECPDSYVHPKDRKRVSRVKEASKTQHHEKTAGETSIPASDEDMLLARLDELERLEEEEDELDRLSLNDSNDTESEDEESSNTQHVRFKDEVIASQPCTIRFKHSNNKVNQTDEMTPGDVDKLIKPKSILKPVDGDCTPSEEMQSNRIQTTESISAISDTVVERAAKTVEQPVQADSTKRVSKFKAARMKR